MLNLRARSVASATLKAMTYDLIHLGQVLEFEGISDLNERLEDGRYLDDSEIEVICEGMGLQTSLLRRLNDPKVSPMKRTSILQNAPAVANDTKHRRITTCVQYIDLVARIGEAQAKAHQRRERAARRLDMVEFFKKFRPKGRSSRVRNAVRADDLARVVSFIATGDPSAVWKTPHLRERNWAIVTLLTLGGLRQSELRQLRADDIDTNQCSVTVHRRPDDPDDPRVDEPNAKTADRIIPISHEVADRLDAYLLGCGQEGALMSGSPFAFLSAGNNSFGRPISSWVVETVVRQLGEHLGVQRLHPHALRSAWVQHLSDWASSEGIEPAELDRFANYLGGWSYFSKSASHYRGDHLTQKAFEAGLIVEEAR
jgi:integrase